MNAAELTLLDHELDLIAARLRELRLRDATSRMVLDNVTQSIARARRSCAAYLSMLDVEPGTEQELSS